MPTEDELAGRQATSGHITDHQVVRDSNFVRIYADAAISLRAPRTLEIGLLKIERKLTDCKVEEGNEIPTEFDMGPGIAEVARVTFPMTVALSLAMDMLSELVPTGLYDPDQLQEDFDSFIAKARENRADSEKN